MPAPDREARLALTAARQGGAFTFSQALDLGFSRGTVSNRLARGTWRRLHPGVYAVGGSPSTRLMSLWAAVLAVGSGGVVSHESAALLHGGERLAAQPITLTNPHGWHHRLADVFVHQIDDLHPTQRTSIARLPVSAPARTVVELGATQGPETVGRIADDLVRLRRTSYPAIAAVLAAVARPGKPGVVAVANMLEARTGGYVPPSSELERMLFDTLEAGGLPPPQRQVRLPGRGQVAGLADAAYPDAQIVIEADGRRWHTRMDAARRDRERDAQVVRAGWVALRFVYEQLRDDPGEVCAVVAETRARRLALIRPAA